VTHHKKLQEYMVTYGVPFLARSTIKDNVTFGGRGDRRTPKAHW